MDALKERNHVDDGERMKIMEMIERTYEENPLYEGHSSEEVEALEDRLEGLDIVNLAEDDIDKVLERLTKEERDDFHRMIESGQIFELYNKQSGTEQQWEPFWHKHDNALIKIIDDDTSEKPKLKPTNIIKKSSVNVLFNLANVLYPYASFQSIYNGSGHRDFPLDFADCILSCSDFLASNKVFESVEEALLEPAIKTMACCKQRDMPVTERFLIECIRSTSHILIGPNPNNSSQYTVKALKQIQSACTNARKELKKSKEASEKRKHLFVVAKKMDFLITWAEENRDKLALLSVEVVELFKARVSQFDNDKRIEKDIKKAPTATPKSAPRPKIVELD